MVEMSGKLPQLAENGSAHGAALVKPIVHLEKELKPVAHVATFL